MATYYDLRRVQGLCSCNRSAPLSQLYFCRHCYDVRCGNCVSHEVDSHYCPNCLENMTSAEAKMRKHRCGNCFECPSCGHTLSTRGTLALAPASGITSSTSPGEAPMTPQKTYYLHCAFCRWTTRESGIPDQKSPGGWQEKPNLFAERIEKLINEYGEFAKKEKNEKERSKYKKRKYILSVERFPVLTPRFRRRYSNWGSYGRDTNPSVDIKISSAEAAPVTESFNVDDLVSKPFVFEKVTSIHQRHMSPWLQPTETLSLEPRHKALAVKRSLRCKKCEHTLSKADFNPSFIKFRINLSALYHLIDLHFSLPPSVIEPSVSSDQPLRRVTPMPLPTVTFDSVPPSRELKIKSLSVEKPINVILVLSNPAHRITTVKLRQLTPEEETEKLKEFFIKTGSSSPTYSTVKLDLPTTGITIAAKSDVSEYNDLVTGQTTNEFQDDDPKLIAYRHGHRVGINVGLRLLAKTEGSQPLRAAIQMNFDYLNTTASIADTRTSTMNAVLAAAAPGMILRDNAATTKKKSVEEESGNQGGDYRDVGVLYLMDFGTEC
ncbi:unnamed protein product [Rodentolepis nana]|uniref:Dynactin subunit 4 n=1 Tax=Rodentolepis nana TaxID=102285 RepID=A0A0R3TLP0_RODNA|nr:unnamed protein product [Rodentolepis nana]